jgi:hypothetical protein
MLRAQQLSAACVCLFSPGREQQGPAQGRGLHARSNSAACSAHPPLPPTSCWPLLMQRAAPLASCSPATYHPAFPL